VRRSLGTGSADSCAMSKRRACLGQPGGAWLGRPTKDEACADAVCAEHRSRGVAGDVQSRVGVLLVRSRGGVLLLLRRRARPHRAGRHVIACIVVLLPQRAMTEGPNGQSAD